jgi:CheY-like chemotaxis protein
MNALSPKLSAELADEPGSQSDHTADLRSDRHPLKGLSILIADDCEDTRHLYMKLLSLYGARVEAAVDGEDACERVDQKVFDLILMDLLMPGTNGIEAVRRLRKSGHRTPVLALSAYPEREHRRVAASAGFNGYVTKPTAGESLVRKILDCLARQSQS